MSHLQGKIALITGASRGIGEATAVRLAQQGAHVWLVSRRLEACERIAASIRADGGKADALACDVSDYDAVLHVVEHIVQQHGAIDLLINNAGVIEPIGSLWELDGEAWQHNIAVNLNGVFHSCRAVLPYMIQRRSGAIVNVSSGAAHGPKEGWSAYCASKAGVAMLTQSIHMEAAQHGIRVYGFQPGVVDTEMQQVIRDSGINEVSRLKREQLAHPDEPAHIIAWLCSEEAASHAGEELTIRDSKLREKAGLHAYTGV